jgi:hypothetical protein
MKVLVLPTGEWWKRYWWTVIIAVLIIAIVCLAVFLPRGKTVIEEVEAPILLPTRAEVEASLPDIWFRGISWELMFSRVNEKFPGIARVEFEGGAKFMVLILKEGEYFVAPSNQVLPWTSP